MKKEIYDTEGLNPVKFSGTTFTIYLNTKSPVSFSHNVMCSIQSSQ